MANRNDRKRSRKSTGGFSRGAKKRAGPKNSFKNEFESFLDDRPGETESQRARRLSIEAESRRPKLDDAQVERSKRKASERVAKARAQTSSAQKTQNVVTKVEEGIEKVRDKTKDVARQLDNKTKGAQRAAKEAGETLGEEAKRLNRQGGAVQRAKGKLGQGLTRGRALFGRAVGKVPGLSGLGNKLAGAGEVVSDAVGTTREAAKDKFRRSAPKRAIAKGAGLVGRGAAGTAKLIGPLALPAATVIGGASAGLDRSGRTEERGEVGGDIARRLGERLQSGDASIPESFPGAGLINTVNNAALDIPVGDSTVGQRLGGFLNSDRGEFAGSRVAGILREIGDTATLGFADKAGSALADLVSGDTGGLEPVQALGQRASNIATDPKLRAEAIAAANKFAQRRGGDPAAVAAQNSLGAVDQAAGLATRDNDVVPPSGTGFIQRNDSAQPTRLGSPTAVVPAAVPAAEVPFGERETNIRTPRNIGGALFAAGRLSNQRVADSNSRTASATTQQQIIDNQFKLAELEQSAIESNDARAQQLVENDRAEIEQLGNPDTRQAAEVNALARFTQGERGGLGEVMLLSAIYGQSTGQANFWNGNPYDALQLFLQGIPNITLDNLSIDFESGQVSAPSLDGKGQTNTFELDELPQHFQDALKQMQGNRQQARLGQRG